MSKNNNIEKFLGYLKVNDNEAWLELDKYYHLVEIVDFDINVNTRTNQLRIHNVFCLSPNRCIKNGEYIGTMKK